MTLYIWLSKLSYHSNIKFNEDYPAFRYITWRLRCFVAIDLLESFKGHRSPTASPPFLPCLSHWSFSLFWCLLTGTCYEWYTLPIVTVQAKITKTRQRSESRLQCDEVSCGGTKVSTWSIQGYILFFHSAFFLYHQSHIIGNDMKFFKKTITIYI